MATTNLRKTTLLISIAFFYFSIVNGQKCKTPYNFDIASGSFIVAYNISSAEKAVQSCYEVLNYQGVHNDEFTYRFIQGGIQYNLPVNVKIIDQRAVLIYQEDTTHVLDFYSEVLPNDIVVCYFCRGTEEFILLGYLIGKELSKEADEVGKKFTNNPSAYKTNHE